MNTDNGAAPCGDDLLNLLARLEAKVDRLVEQPPAKQYYTPKEFGKIVGLSRYTVSEHCRHGRLRAEKRRTGRGRSLDWQLSHAELLRYRNEGLLPAAPTSTRI